MTMPKAVTSSSACIAGMVLILALAPAAVVAEPAKELAVVVGYHAGGEFEDAATGKAVELDEGESYGLHFYTPIDRSSEIELMYSHQTTDLLPAGSFTGDALFGLDIDYFHLGGTTAITPSDGQNAVPYVSGTFGATHFDPDRSDLNSETRFSLSLGVGVRKPVGERLSLRLEGRGLMSLLNSGGSMFCSGGACNVSVSGSGFVQFEVLASLGVRFN